MQKPLEQLLAASSTVFEAQSIKNSGKFVGIVWKIFPCKVPRDPKEMSIAHSASQTKQTVQQHKLFLTWWAGLWARAQACH